MKSKKTNLIIYIAIISMISISSVVSLWVGNNMKVVQISDRERMEIYNAGYRSGSLDAYQYTANCVLKYNDEARRAIQSRVEDYIELVQEIDGITINEPFPCSE